MGCSKAKYEELMEEQGWYSQTPEQYTYMYGGRPTKKVLTEDLEVVDPIEVVSKAQERKNTPVYSGALVYFPDALKEVSKASLAGNIQHGNGDKLFWDKTKSSDNEDALVRHLIDHSKNPVDDDGVLHLAKVAWRSLAALQIYLENNE